MLECYFHQCPHHPKTEPFCSLPECIATKSQLEQYSKLRADEIKTKKIEAE